MELPKRKNTRLQDYDYSSNGAYFITVCTHNRRNLFGEIVVGAIHESPEMQHNEFGLIAVRQIAMLSERFPETKIDAFCVMPNHIHMIVVLGNERAIRESPLRRSVISQMIGYLKAGITKNIRQINVQMTVWQRGYHDYIIRNEADYRRIWQYIDENTAKWTEDKYYYDD